MARETEELREQLARCGPRTRGARVPPGVRAAIATYARRARARGGSLVGIATAVGVSPESIRRWTQGPAGPRPRSLVPVVLAAAPIAPDAAITVTAPGGYRVEGLTVPQVATLLRALA